jgi:acyl-CoA synthetase (AMP-forming)/AMP-acid ligase II
MAAPKLLLMDEPSLGLAPLIVREMFEAIKRIVASGTTVLLIEQNTQGALSAAHYGYVRYINTGGAPLFPEIQERFTRITGVPVMQGYGLTESSPTTPVNPLDRIKVGSIGWPLANTEDKIVNPGSGRNCPPRKWENSGCEGPKS